MFTRIGDGTLSLRIAKNLSRNEPRSSGHDTTMGNTIKVKGTTNCTNTITVSRRFYKQ